MVARKNILVAFGNMGEAFSSAFEKALTSHEAAIELMSSLSKRGRGG